jgi:hypothetical protein
MPKITPLLTFLRALDKDQRKAFAAATGTTEQYLYQMAGLPRPNPTLRLATLLVEQSKVFGKRAMAKPLWYDDLLVGTAEDDSAGPDGY